MSKSRAKREGSGTEGGDDFLSERVRAEDIILGSLGFGGEAEIISIHVIESGFQGRGRWPDGEEFDFSSTEKPSELERWALRVLGNL